MPKVQMTTLGYIEKDDSYLMLHRVKKKMTSIKINGLVSAENLSTVKARRNVLSGKPKKRPDF